jgi:hypothetical protein
MLLKLQKQEQNVITNLFCNLNIIQGYGSKLYPCFFLAHKYLAGVLNKFVKQQKSPIFAKEIDI